MLMAAVEQRDNMRLVGKPFVIVDARRERQVVVAASREALHRSIRVGVTLRQARAISSQLEVVPLNAARYRRAAYGIMEVLATFTPYLEMEVTRPQEVALKNRPMPSIQEDELAGIWFLNPGRLLKSDGLKLAAAMRGLIAEQVQLDCTVGLAANKFTARIAAGSLRLGEAFVVPRGQEKEFLAPFPVGVLPMYVEQREQLRLLGVNTLGELAQRSTAALQVILGKQAAPFKRRAEGRDSSAVALFTPRLVERAIHQFDDPVADRGIIQRVIVALAENLAMRLEQQGQVAPEIGLQIRQSNGETRIGGLLPRQPIGGTKRLTQAVMDLLDQMRFTTEVLEIEIALSGITRPEAKQLTMFRPETVSQDTLQQVLGQLIARHGTDIFYWADVTDPYAQLAEDRFRLRNAEDAA